MKKIMLFLILGLFCISLANAYLGSYEQGETVVVRAELDNATSANISIYYPNSSLAVDNQPLTNLKGDIWNYSFDFTTSLGDYVYDYCDQNGKNCKENYFKITQTGHNQSTAESIGSAIFLFLMIFLTAFFIFMGFKLSETENLWILGLFFLFLSLIFIVYDVYLGYEYHLNYIGANNASKIPEVLFFIFMTTMTAGLLVSGILLFKRLPEVLDWFKTNVAGKDEDGWDGDHNR